MCASSAARRVSCRTISGWSSSSSATRRGRCASSSTLPLGDVSTRRGGWLWRTGCAITSATRPRVRLEKSSAGSAGRCSSSRSRLLTTASCSVFRHSPSRCRWTSSRASRLTKRGGESSTRLGPRRSSGRASADEARRRILDEIGASSLFGARFRMNAARALLLPRGSARRRMPLWLQRLKALDLLQSVREHPSFPILVETYRDVLTDAFDMDALAQVLGRIGREELLLHPVETTIGSPFASTLQFGFVMDWMYGDDAPRAEQRAALLSLDQALLAEVMGDEGADAETIAALEELLGRRRGTAPGSRARTADELSLLIDRAGYLSSAEVDARVASVEEGRKAMADPKAE